MPDWLLDETGLAIVRRAYARQMLAIANVRNDRLEQVFATVRREEFLGPAPWRIVQWPPGTALPIHDPVCVYQDVVVALAPERGVNNGSPSLHAKMLNDLAVELGQHVAQIGAGGGTTRRCWRSSRGQQDVSSRSSSIRTSPSARGPISQRGAT